MTLSGIASELLSPASRDHNIPTEGWQQWKQRDEQVREQVHNKCVIHSVDNVLLIIDVPLRKPHDNPDCKEVGTLLKHL